MDNILIVGKPNTGKSLLFNRMTGLKQKVANFPGATVEIKVGKFENSQLVDFPGVYSLNAISKDEVIAIDKLHEALHDDKTSLVICTLDATRLERSLIMGLQVQNLAIIHKKPLVFVLNMIDETDRFDHVIDFKKMEEILGSRVFPLSARTQKGLEQFISEIKTSEASFDAYLPTKSLVDLNSVFETAKNLGKDFGAKADVVLKRQNKLDSFLLNNNLGGIIFLMVMLVIFQSIFTWASPLMDLVEEGIGLMSSFVSANMSEGVVRDFIQDAIFGGLGSFLVFAPQIMILTFIIGILEDSGYLPRAALICHRPLSFFGLSGKSFIPYLTGHACAIPAIMAARTIESPRKRLLTMMTVPLMSCSARLPVYALLVAALIPNVSYLGGIINLQGLVFFGLYLFGIVVALIICAVVNNSTKKSDAKEMPFILELPPYRLPHWKPLFLKVYDTTKKFVVKAGPIIFLVSVVIWVLGYFPNNGNLETSFLGQIGRFVGPVFEPIGLDWRYGVAILVSFLAREVFVGTLGTLFGIEGADENIAALSENIQNEGLLFGTGVGLLLFYVVALQCVATVAVLKSETGSSKIAWGLFVGYGVLAYALAFLAHTFI